MQHYLLLEEIVGQLFAVGSATANLLYHMPNWYKSSKLDKINLIITIIFLNTIN